MSNASLPLVSVIIPIYNSGRFLPDTVESVIRQEYHNWELILIDDGSSDNSSTIAKNYAAKNTGKIFYFEHDGHINKGVCATRNVGISKARGEFVALLDSDDLWKPVKLKEQVEFLLKNPHIDVLSEATLYWNSWSDADLQDEIIYVGAPAEKTYQPPQLAWKMYPLGPGRAPCMCGIMIRTAALKSIEGFEEAFTGKNQLYEDQAFAIKMYLHLTVHISSKCNNIYRQRADSLMHGLVDEGFYGQGRHFFLQWLSSYLKRKRIKNLRVTLFLCKALVPYRFPSVYKFFAQVWWKYRDKFKLSLNGQ
ncbi:MAG: family 2 glycosyl transferase [Segetibacter sp.]|nr:family 2 glycosyl transferase [Segetibacter sp.]